MSFTPTIQTTDNALPLPPALIELLLREIQTAYCQSPPEPEGAQVLAMTIVFRDPNYDPLAGGYHPVEIRLGHVERNSFRLGYITDFSYTPVDGRHVLLTEIDFEFSVELCKMRHLPPIALSRVGDFFDLYISNFLSYYANGVYDVDVVWET
ncbi:hypothetical protein GCM10022228_04830 [Halomonas cibimaris]|uniref:DUF2787 domain-containing protein n=1 Tax=Halomonas cibimaris TaxID=657012 RepID=A0ABP7LAX7_9GAMM